VEELAEILAVDFNTSEGIPKLNDALRWEDHEQAVLSACSSLIAIIKGKYGSRVVQFSHFSVKEFLTSDRLGTSKMDASCYHHISLEPAHMIMAQACLSVLLRSDPPIDAANIKDFPLAEYAGEHFGDHAEFGSVLSHIWDGVDHLLDTDKSHFTVWVQIRPLERHPQLQRHQTIIPLYYVAARGYRGLVDYLISKCPDDMNVRGHSGTPLHAALGGAHADVAQLLLEYGINVDVRNNQGQNPLHLAAYHGFLGITRMLVERNVDINVPDNSGDTPLHQTMNSWFEMSESTQDGRLDVAKFLLDHGADPDAKNRDHQTPLHAASLFGSIKGAQMMLEHGANMNARTRRGQTPLHQVLDGLNDTYDTLDMFLDTMRFLLAHDADLDALDDNHATPLHVASHWGCVEGAQLLLEHSANVHLEDKMGRTPSQVATEDGNTNITQLLSEHLRSQQKT
jgi:ankyrin repeat protein